MTRLVIALVALTVTAACDRSPAEPENEVAAVAFFLNGDMEGEAGWYFHAPPGMSAAYATGQGLDGSRGVALTGHENGPPDSFPLVYQGIPAGDLTGRELTLEAQIRLQNVEGPGFAIALRGDDPAGDPVRSEAFASTEGSLDINGTRDWAPVSVRLGNIYAGITRITVFLIYLPGTSGTVYVDDVRLSAEPRGP